MLSSTRIVRLARLIVGFLRHVGPYEQVAPSRFQRLSTWAKRRGIAGESPLLLGIAHDAPGVTPAERIRFDCCIQVPEVFEPDGVIACQRTPGGDYAVTEYIGSWDLGPAYSAIFRRILNNPSLEVIGLPAIEIYPTARIGRRRGLAHVSIAIPVKLRKSLSTSKRGDSLTAGATMPAP
jgi:AraC family transcriptional regulator